MKLTTLTTTLLLLATLTSCGGGGDTQTADGGIGGTGITQGKVSGFGSIFVNGVEFETDNADFLIEEEAGFGEEAIKLGMVVHITGDNDGVTGTAVTVTYSSQLKGLITDPIQLDNDGVGTMQVMNQTVHVDQTTIFRDDTNQDLLITELAQNDVIEVSGFSDGFGTIYATRIELKSHDWTSDDTLSIKGIVTNLTDTSFDIGGLTVNFSGALSLPDGNPQEGWFVEAKGDSFMADGQFEADEVEIEGDGDLEVAEDGEEVELEGIVSSPLSGDLFSLNGQPVSIANLTIDGSEIIEGRELEVEGVMVDGIVEANEIKFEAVVSELQDMSSIVEAIKAEDINTGTFDLLGQSVSVTSSTVMEDELGDDRDFNLSVLSVGEYVKVDIYHDGTGLVAVKLERESTPEPLESEIEGLVEEIDINGNPNLIRAVGVLIDITATDITPAIGDRVEITGNYIDDILTATAGEIEEEEPDE